MPSVGGQLEGSGLSDEEKSIIKMSWKAPTLRLYDLYLKKLTKFCSERGEDPTAPTANNLANFLAELSQRGLGYSAPNTARSAVASLTFSSDPPGPHSHC